MTERLDPPEPGAGARVRWPAFVLAGSLAAIGLLLLVTGLLLWWQGRERYDILIVGGRVFDGERFLPSFQSVAIRHGKIARIGAVYGARAGRILHAGGQIVSPGFIDTHVHIENSLRGGGPVLAPNFARMGVTTVVTGNCGRSAPDLAAEIDKLQRFGGHVNVATLAGHNTIRSKVMKERRDAPNATELQAMRQALEEDLRLGALGFSTGLEYPPGVYTGRQEAAELAKVAARWHGIYATHLRNEGTRLKESLEEAFYVAGAGHIHLHVSHLKVASPLSWGTMPEILAMLDACRRKLPGLTEDAYSYPASSSGIGLLLPEEFRDMQGHSREVLANPERRAALVRGILNLLASQGLQDFSHCLIANYDPKPEWQGKRVPEIVSWPEREPDWLSPLVPDRDKRRQVWTILYLWSHGGAQMNYFVMDEKDVAVVLSDPHVSIGTDSSVRNSADIGSHPRGSGNFPRVLAKYVREDRVLGWDEALRKMTSFPAEIFHLTGRGRLREGAPADVVVFDPLSIADRATFEAPLEAPAGISAVIVNGRIVVDNGAVRRVYPGRFLRNPARSPGPMPPMLETNPAPVETVKAEAGKVAAALRPAAPSRTPPRRANRAAGRRRER